MSRVLALGAFLLAASAARADQAEHIKAIEKHGGKVRIINIRGGVVFIDLNKCKTADDAVGDLGSLKSALESLDLTGSNFSDRGMKQLKDCEVLRGLSLNESKATDAGIQELNDMKHIRWLILKNTGVTAKGAQQLRRSLQETYIIME